METISKMTATAEIRRFPPLPTAKALGLAYGLVTALFTIPIAGVGAFMMALLWTTIYNRVVPLTGAIEIEIVPKPN